MSLKISIGIVIGIIATILFFIFSSNIKKSHTIPIPAIPTCIYGYTLNSDSSECIENIPNIPTICSDHGGRSFEKNKDGYCYMKCLPNQTQKEFTCGLVTGGVGGRTQVRPNCPPGYTLKIHSSLKKGDYYSIEDEICVGNKKIIKPKYSCEEQHILARGNCYLSQ